MAVETHAGWPVPRRVQVIGAHSAGFVWRAGGAVAKAVSLGGTAEVIALSCGERGESGELWQREGQTIENVKRIRHAEAERAAAHLGASFRSLDLGDYPLQIGTEELLAIADAIRAFAPDVLITHTDADPFNPDHPVAHAAVDRARSLAAGAGVSSAFATIKPPQLFLFEPHRARALPLHADRPRGHHRGLGEGRGDGRDAGPAVPADLLHAARRAARQPRAAGLRDSAVRYGESFMRVLPQVVEEL